MALLADVLAQVGVQPRWVDNGIIEIAGEITHLPSFYVKLTRAMATFAADRQVSRKRLVVPIRGVGNRSNTIDMAEQAGDADGASKMKRVFSEPRRETE